MAFSNTIVSVIFGRSRQGGSSRGAITACRLAIRIYWDRFSGT